MKIFLTFFLVLTYVSVAQSSELKPFETDNCTLFFDGSSEVSECCVKHDIEYWIGGNKKMRARADKNLKACVSEKAGSFLANIMYIGVRIGHASPIKTKYQWSWGWDWAKGEWKNKEKFNFVEKAYIVLRLIEAEQNPEYWIPIVDQLNKY